MKTDLPDLGGKYYETKMSVTLDDGRVVDIELTSVDSQPSPRELADPDFEICDGHYERDATFIVAREIYRKLNDEWVGYSE